ncbi:MAG: hypothetical protein ACOCRO_06665, partial [Halanaerobiales bacterium]
MKKDNLATETIQINKEYSIDNNSESLSHKQLMWRVFKRHKLAVSAVIVLIAFYVIVIISGFVAPNDPHQRWSKYVLAPPQVPRFIDNERNFNFRPFVYGLEQKIDPDTWQRTFTLDY